MTIVTSFTILSPRTHHVRSTPLMHHTWLEGGNMELTPAGRPLSSRVHSSRARDAICRSTLNTSLFFPQWRSLSSAAPDPWRWPTSSQELPFNGWKRPRIRLCFFLALYRHSIVKSTYTTTYVGLTKLLIFVFQAASEALGRVRAGLGTCSPPRVAGRKR